MKLPILKFILTGLFLYVFASFFTVKVEAASLPPVSKDNLMVTATVGEFYLNISGYQSPNASIVMNLKDGTFVRSAVCDSNGYFSISQILIKNDFNGFCLTAVDFKRLGESTTCLDVSTPVTGNITMSDLFLPPTLGLQRTEINEGSEAVAFGYTMPNAIVTLSFNTGQKLTVQADATGYYEFHITGLTAGTYQLSATANLNGTESLKPTSTKELKTLTLAEQYTKKWRTLWDDILRFLTGLGLGPLWLIIPILILIIILLAKLYPDKFSFIYDSRLYQSYYDFTHKKKKLHHAWFIGY